MSVTGTRARPGPPTPHLPLTWLAAMFALLVGIAMAYVPYEFQADVFRALSPHVRLVGACFLASSAVLLATALYPRAPRVLDLAGRLLFCDVLGVYGWLVHVLPGELPRTLLPRLLAAGVLLEARPAPRERELFRLLVAGALLLFACLRLLPPERLAPALPEHLLAWRWPLALLFLAPGVMLLMPGARWRARRGYAFGLACVLLGALAYGLGRAGAWADMALYLVLAVASLGAMGGVRLGPPRTVRGKLLRGLAFTGLLPLVVLGAVAVYLAQQTLEREVREESLQAALGEAALLEGLLDGAWESLRLVRDAPGFSEAVEADAPPRITGFLRHLPEHVPAFEAAFVVSPQGQGLADCSPSDGIRRANFSQRDYFQGALRTDGDYVSRPFLSVKGRPVVALVSPIREGPHLRGLLVGLLSLERLTRTVTPATQRFRVQVVDRRGLERLRDTAGQAPLLARAELPAALAEAVSTGNGAVLDTFDAAHRRTLTTPLPVRGSPWAVLVSQEVSAAYRPLTRLSATLIALVALTVLVVLGLSQVVARELIRRLETLHQATTALARGELRQRVEVTEEDELGSLGHGFNQMAGRLEEGQAALARSNQELREAVRLREEFLSVAGHELRTPLTPLKGYVALTLQRLEAAADFPERERTLKALRSISRQTERLSRLVGELLDITRLRAGRFELERTPVDLVPLVREVLERFEQAHAPALRFEFQPPAEPVVGLWDEARLEQVLTNLLSNAARYSPQGGCVRVDFQLEPATVEMRVRDEGIGIPAESLPGLFQPFARAANATSRHFGGLGLGLFICREIVERHGGHIWAESAGAQQGSCFHVRLPRRAVAAEPVPLAAAGGM